MKVDMEFAIKPDGIYLNNLCVDRSNFIDMLIEHYSKDYKEEIVHPSMVDYCKWYVFDDLGLTLSYRAENAEIINIYFNLYCELCKIYPSKSEFCGKLYLNSKNLYHDMPFDYFPFNGDFIFQNHMGKIWESKSNVLCVDADFGMARMQDSLKKYCVLTTLIVGWNDC